MITIKEIAKEVYDKIANVYQHGFQMKDENGKDTTKPSDAKLFIFPFLKGHDFSQIMVTLSDGTDDQQDEKHNGKLSVQYYENIDKYLTPALKEQWKNFRSGLKDIAIRNLWDYDDQNISRPAFTKKPETDKTDITIDNLKHKTDIAESLTGTSRTSYQNLGPVRIIARHFKKIDPEQSGARSRNIGNLFIETAEGERFKCPEGTTLNGARAIARHFKNGGNLQDDFGQHITTIIKEMHDLRFFVRNMRGKTFEDVDTNNMVQTAIDHYGDLHRTLFSLRGQRGYNQYKELWEPEQDSDNTFDLIELKEKFSRKVFDERLTVALPIVDKLYKKAKSRELQEFEDWSSDIIEEIENNPIDKQNTEQISQKADIEENIFDNEDIDPKIQSILDKNGFLYNIEDGTVFFDSQEEVERAKDFFAAEDPNMEFPKMGVSNYKYGLYGATTNDREIVDQRPMEESKNNILDMIKLAGLAK
jgi:hypothetical protein